ncbi:MAG TPA: YceI family protein [Bacteroidia bacterium]|nr:YceI family protein [Bacteroidia bacterium]
MKRKYFFILTLAVLLLSAFTITTVWKADEKTSTINWKASGHKGSFDNLISTIDFDKTKLKESRLNAFIEVKTLKADDESVKAHLLSSDYFDAEKFPKISFMSTAITSGSKGFVAKGNLTMKNSTKLIEFPFTFKEDGTEKATFSGTMTINAADYGVTKKKVDVVIYLVIPVSKGMSWQDMSK